jgi:antitoxin (DNA-binding transcriptional repressor) of toxin-antitoxin stability system
MMAGMEPRILRVSEADAVRDLAAILQRVQAGTEVVIERDAQPLAVIRAAGPERRTISECIALAAAHEKGSGEGPVLDPDFAADVEAIVRDRKAWNPPT